MNLIASNNFPLPEAPHENYRGNASQSGNAAKIFFIDILAAIHRNWKLAVITGGAAALMVLAVTFSMTPLYKSTATVMLDTRRQQVVNLEAVLSNLPSDSFVVDSEVEVLKSPTLARRVIAALNLDRDPEFNGALRDISLTSTLVAEAKSAIRSGLAAIGIGKTGADGKDARRNESIVLTFLDRLEIDRVGLTYVIRITFWSADPEKAERIANGIAQQYIAQQEDMKLNATQSANALLDSRVKDLREKLRDAEQKVADYKAQNGLLDAVGAPLSEAEISALSTQLATARAEQAQHEGILGASMGQSRRGGSEAVGAAAMSDTVRELRAQQAEVVRREVELSRRYGPKHPDLIKAREQRMAIDSAIDTEIRRIISNQQAEAAAARQRTVSLAASVENVRQRLAKNSMANVKLAELEREAGAVRTLYESLLNRLKQTTAQEGLQDADAKIVSRATMPLKPSSPSWTFAAAIAAALAALVAAVAIAWREMMDGGLKSPEEAETSFGLPVLATIPWLSSGDPAVHVLERPNSAFAEALRNLRTSLFVTRSGVAPKVVMVASAVPGEGKTSTVLALGRQAANSGASVVIVDADLHRRTLTAKLPFTPENGIAELASGEASLESCLVRDPRTSAMILPVGGRSPMDTDAFFAQDLNRMFETLRAHFDVVLVDTAPLLPLADPRIIANHADTVVMLARWHRTSRQAIGEAVRILRGIEAPIAGLALTCVDLKLLGSFGYAPASGNYRRQYAGYYIE